MTAVDVVLPELNPRDATGSHSLELGAVLQGMGCDVRFVAERESDVATVTLLRRWRGDADLTILQHSIGSMVADEIVRRELPVVVNYHNVTPFEFLEPWEPDRIEGLRWGRAQLDALAPTTRLGIADSAYNARDLVTAGVDDVVVAPILFEPATLFGGPAVVPLTADGPLWLFVGRLDPHKAQHDLVAALAAARHDRPDTHLALVGGAGPGSYRAALDRLARELGVAEALHLVGPVSGAELAGWYERADVFVCLSDHEGFCVPLLEAMHHGTPIVAHAAAAVPETLGGAGVLVGDKRPSTVADAVARVLDDDDLRNRLDARARARLGELGIEPTRVRFREVLERLLPSGNRS